MTPTLPNGDAPNGPYPAARAGTAEMSETLRQMRSRTPEEALGLADGPGLLPAFGIASVVALVLLAALTVGPYFLDTPTPTAAQQVKPETPAAPQDAKPAQPTPGAPDSGGKKPAAASADPAKPPPGVGPDIVDKLGEGGTKAAAPKTNPLDKKDDDLLKDLK